MLDEMYAEAMADGETVLRFPLSLEAGRYQTCVYHFKGEEGGQEVGQVGVWSLPLVN